jgi:hypothetical protein
MVSWGFSSQAINVLWQITDEWPKPKAKLSAELKDLIRGVVPGKQRAFGACETYSAEQFRHPARQLRHIKLP